MSSSDAKLEQEAAWTRAAPRWLTWNDVIVRSNAAVSARMLELGGVAPGQRILDIASGTGEPALDAAARVGPTGSVLGLDFSEPMLEVARKKARSRQLVNIEFCCVDGEELDVPPGSVDVVTCKYGLMFMPDPLACLSRSHVALRAGGRFVAANWAGPDRNPWTALPVGLCRRRLGVAPPAPDAPGMFALADPERNRQLVEQAGFRRVDIVEQPMAWGPFSSIDGAATFASEAIGPVAAMLTQMSADDRAAFADELRAAYAPFQTEAGVALPGVTWIVTGTA
jgi:ubiquinone/menaquinone biosynthesis C-methylase UbiE